MIAIDLSARRARRFASFNPAVPGGRALPERLRQALEALSGFDMSDVRVHFDSGLPAEVGARALACGLHIHLQPGAEDALAHEAWHVVQQKQGRATPTGLVNGVAVNDDPTLEAEANQMSGAAERSGALLAVEECPHAVLRSGPIARPVVQRWIVAGTNTYSSAEARDYLNLHHHVTAGNTPHVQEVIDDISNANLDFASWDSLKTEVKRRNFGRRHFNAMNALKEKQDIARNAFEQALYARAEEQETERPDLANVIHRFSSMPEGKQGSLINKYGSLSFVYWAKNSAPLLAQQIASARENHFYKWYTNQMDYPLRMNCWECVLYGGAWTGLRNPLYGRDYALWALLDREVPAVGAFGGSSGTQPAPLFVDEIMNNPVYFAAATKVAGGAFIKLPEKIPAGMIVVFASGQHVALATGAKRRNKDNAAVTVYGDWGHEVLELDGKTAGMTHGTIEDGIAGGYNVHIHLGWLPELQNTQPVRLVSSTTSQLLYQVDARQTTFYT